jgi:hypothetical protein
MQCRALNRILRLSNSSLYSTLSSQASDTSPRLQLQICIVFAALAILYLRMPASFTNPQFWAEDTGFFTVSRLHGWGSLFTPMAGYLVFVQFLVAILASYFDPIAAPAIFNYSAFLLTMVVVWMVTSPRLDLPSKPLLAIAIVVVPMGFEELGTLTNIQWLLPIGAFVLLFTRASKNPCLLGCEVLFLGVTALSGPFSIFLTPLFLWRSITACELIERRRLMLLTAVVGCGAFIQLLVIAAHHSEVIDPVAPISYSWTLWVSLPFTQIMTTFGPASDWFHGGTGFALGLVFLTAAATLACQRPYRTQKLFMLILALAIAISGMYKFRAALEGQSGAQRYFYLGAIFSLWFICCLNESKYWRIIAIWFVALVEVSLLPVVFHTPRIQNDFEWYAWARFIPSGLSIIIPSTPKGFYLGFKASANGPLSKFNNWLGKDLTHVVNEVDPSYCIGNLGRIVPLDIVNLQTSDETQRLKRGWVTSGSAWDATHNRPVQLVVLVDQNNRVTGFGLPGFKQISESAPSTPASGWNAIFYAEPGASSIRAYGILNDGERLCPLANEHSFPAIDVALASEDLLGASSLLPGTVVRQRFRPEHPLEGISARFVNFGHQPSSYKVSWRASGSRDGHVLELGSGTIDASTVGDWQIVELPLSAFAKETLDEIEISFRVEAGAPAALPVGLPLYRPVTDAKVPTAEIGGVPAANGALLDLRLSYSP